MLVTYSFSYFIYPLSKEIQYSDLNLWKLKRVSFSEHWLNILKKLITANGHITRNINTIPSLWLWSFLLSIDQCHLKPHHNFQGLLLVTVVMAHKINNYNTKPLLVDLDLSLPLNTQLNTFLLTQNQP